MRRLWNRLFDSTGFRGKTLWDFIGLLIVPLVIALAGWWLSEISTRNQQQIENQRAQAQQQIEDDRVRESVLQSYIQDMTELLLDKGLATSKQDQPVRGIARSRTLTAVRLLDADRKGILLQFLAESNLIGTGTVNLETGNIPDTDPIIITPTDPIILLFGADLSDANLDDAFLPGTDLRSANLTRANLYRADLSNADLTHADLSSAFLPSASLWSANLSDANLSRTVLDDAFLSDADLSGANLSNANLVGTNLSPANLTGTNLSRANLTGTNLSRADLSHANLLSAEGWFNEQLAEARSLIGATLPNGTVMTEAGWEEFKKRYRK
jgi:uncharacterized protein YjbI with pentapeptide repeats